MLMSLNTLPIDCIITIGCSDLQVYIKLYSTYTLFRLEVQSRKLTIESLFTKVVSQTLGYTLTSRIYTVHDSCHRIDGPATEFSDHDYKWYYRGKCHRVDGPALNIDGCTEWWYHGKRHRVDGPAVIVPAIREEWWCGGELHRLGGPAKTKGTTQKWYLDGIQVSKHLHDDIYAKSLSCDTS